jgi:N-acetyl-alpha-D-glucosaminyl L-malate synthase BshA
MNIGITCYPSVGGSGILASALGEELALRGHEVHFISYERPFRLPLEAPRIHFHPVSVSGYGLFKYPDYTLPLSVKMAEISVQHRLDVLHVHYAVPHATAAILAKSMLPSDIQPRVVTTLHGTDTTLLGDDPGYGPAIRHALTASDAITTVSAYLERETRRLLRLEQSIEVIHNFFEPHSPQRLPADVRKELGLDREVVVLHSSNLRPLKRINLLLEAISRVRPREAFRLLVLAGDSFAAYEARARELGLEDRLLVLEKVTQVEDYLQIADIGFYTSETESFCLSILEGMCFGSPSVSTAVGGIPEVVEDGVSGVLVPTSEPKVLGDALQQLIDDAARRQQLGKAARERAREKFSAAAIVPLYEALYERVCGARSVKMAEALKR